MLNLVYHQTRDEDVYRALSRRMKDKFDIFGGLPDTIEDDWIENVERLEEMMHAYPVVTLGLLGAADLPPKPPLVTR